jgi:hypothetical protein
MAQSDRTVFVRCKCRAWRIAIHGVLALFAFAVLQASISAPVRAHEGHDHDKPTPLNLPVAPRVVAVTPDYELVAVLSGEQRLTIFLHRFSTNEPIRDAKLTVAVGEHEAEAIAKEAGVFEIAAPWLGGAAPIDVLFKLTLPDDQDLLTGRLERASASGAVATEPSASGRQYQPILYAAIGALMAGVLLTLMVVGALARRQQARAEIDLSAPSNREPAEAKVKALRCALLAMLALLGCAPLAPEKGHAQQAHLPAVPSTMATDQPQRMADGTLFVPKATQHLLSVRTVVTAETQAPRTVELVGTVIPDPNRYGRVQSARPGRIEAPEAGLAYVGKQVQKDELLGYLVPYIEAADKANIESQIAETEARIVKLATILSRYNERPGAMPRVKVDEVEGELNALRRKRAELKPSLVTREEIRAPVAGTISVANVAPGQTVDAREVVFEIVDPSHFWIEAIAYDHGVVSNLSRAFAVTSSGETIPLEFAGLGLALKQQATPLTFRVARAAPNLGIGRPVAVVLQSTVALTGVVLPTSSVVRGQSGLPTVWVKSEAERFEARLVRFERLDGQRVVVAAGLKPDLRVVTEGATLINQIR